jgi:hypothetical protein
MIAVGVDTHKQRHHAVALDPLGQLLGELSFAASAAGYAELQRWAEGLREEQPLVFGIEGAGSWGAGLCEHLQGAGHRVDASGAAASPTASTRSPLPSARSATRTPRRRAAAGAWRPFEPCWSLDGPPSRSARAYSTSSRR